MPLQNYFSSRPSRQIANKPRAVSVYLESHHSKGNRCFQLSSIQKLELKVQNVELSSGLMVSSTGRQLILIIGPPPLALPTEVVIKTKLSVLTNVLLEQHVKKRLS